MGKFKFVGQEISDQDAAELRSEVLTNDTPIGSDAFEFMHGNHDRRLFQYLFDGHSNYLYERKNERPSILVGRKGSGKSTYLNNLARKEKVIGVPVNSWIYTEVTQQIVRILLEQGRECRAERASYIWQRIILTSIVCAASREVDFDEDVLTFVDVIPGACFSAQGSVHLDDFFSGMTSSMRPIEEWTRELRSWIFEDRSLAIDSVERSVHATLHEAGKIAIALVDNEEFVLRRAPGPHGDLLQVAKEASIAGLLNLCGRMNGATSCVQIRYCIPAEQYFSFRELSTSVNKDFARLHLLHWTVGELMSLVAHRLMLHLKVWRTHREDYQRLYDEMRDVDIYDREGAMALVRRILPDRIENERGLEEETLTYILRHFQVLPRQLIGVFNSMLSHSLKSGDGLTFLSSENDKVSEESVRYAIAERESLMADEIISAYADRYPEAADIREKVLPNMPLKFSYKAIRAFYEGQGFHNSAKNILQAHKSNDVEVSPDRFERCLIETGMVGRVVNGPGPGKNGYINAQFEYSLPGKMAVSEHDVFVVHPIFTGIGTARVDAAYGANTFGVYPSDSNPTIETDRHVLRQNLGR